MNFYFSLTGKGLLSSACRKKAYQAVSLFTRFNEIQILLEYNRRAITMTPIGDIDHV
jgi:hypothetical protein